MGLEIGIGWLTILLFGGLALVIPTVVLMLNATAYRPVEGAREDRAPGRAVERVQVVERVRLDQQVAVLAPRDRSPRPILGRVLHGVGRLERGRHAAVQVERIPHLQAVDEDRI